MPGLAGGGGLVKVDVEQPRPKSRKGEARGRGERAGSQNGQPHMGKGEERLRQGAKIPGFAGEADNFIDCSPRFAEFSKEAPEAQGGQFPFEGMGRENQIPLGASDGPQHPAESGQVSQFQVDDIGEGQKGQKKQDPLAGTPIESPALFAGPQGEEDGKLLLGHGPQDFFRVHALGEKKIQADFCQVDPIRWVGQVNETRLGRNSADG